MNHLVLLFLIFCVVSTIVPVLFRLLRGGGGPRDKARALVEYAQKRGYRLVNPALAQALDSSVLEMFRNPGLQGLTHASADINDIEPLHNGTGDWLAFICTLGSREVTVFNLNVTGGGVHASDQGVRFKVAKIKAEQLPRFCLGRNSAIHALETAVDKLVGTSNPAIEVDPTRYPEFAAHYWLNGPDRDAVTAFLREKLRFIETAKLPGVLATNARYLVYFEDGFLVREEEADAFISRVETIVANLLP